MGFFHGLGAVDLLVRGKSYADPMLNYRVDLNGRTFDLTTGQQLAGDVVDQRRLNFQFSGEADRVYHDGVMNLQFTNNGHFFPGTYPPLNLRIDSAGNTYDLATGARLAGAEADRRIATYVASVNATQAPNEHAGTPWYQTAAKVGIIAAAAVVAGPALLSLLGTVTSAIASGVGTAAHFILGTGKTVAQEGAHIITAAIGQHTPLTPQQAADTEAQIQRDAEAYAASNGDDPNGPDWNVDVAEYYATHYGTGLATPPANSVANFLPTLLPTLLPSTPARNTPRPTTTVPIAPGYGVQPLPGSTTASLGGTTVSPLLLLGGAALAAFALRNR